MLKKIKGFVYLFLIFSIILTTDNMIVNASIARSEYEYATVYNKKYRYYSQVNILNNGAEANVGIYYMGPGYSVPTGYMGLQARLYNSSGVLVHSTDWTYNSGEAGMMGKGGATISKIGTYYAKGRVRMYNGNGYNTYTTNSTPYVQFYNASMLTYSLNTSNETYGSDYNSEFIGEVPDLILAEGINGIVGYVRADDLNDNYEPLSPEEAISYQDSKISQREIPLYDKDGTTIIDTFLISDGGLC
ncbi:hypothetical protein [Vallitalea maricola]|uniref:Uncharacterized protein n=1 Tax=Vallitalea maricola TaxID=3074433 RepID=A0ACB5UNJ0_9FIRM|nr:hypothetical protein AN2V17_34290 [Vallitalea sp. AN17-2]